jgi:hypothetical protein
MTVCTRYSLRFGFTQTDIFVSVYLGTQPITEAFLHLQRSALTAGQVSSSRCLKRLNTRSHLQAVHIFLSIKQHAIVAIKSQHSRS